MFSYYFSNFSLIGFISEAKDDQVETLADEVIISYHSQFPGVKFTYELLTLTVLISENLLVTVA